MPDSVVIHLPLGRLAEIERQRALRGRAERVGYVDEIPLRVRRVGPVEAPAAVATLGPEGRVEEAWRALDGRLYRPLWSVRGEEGCTVAVAAEELRRRIGRDARREDSYYVHFNGELVHDTEPLRRAALDRGLGPDGYHPVRRMLDDGRARQAAEAAAIAGNLLFVGERLYHAAPVPGWQVYTGRVEVEDPETGLFHSRVVIQAAPWQPYARPRQRGEPVSDAGVRPWLAFAPRAVNEAEALAEALVRELGAGVPAREAPTLRRGGTRGPGYRVLDEAALAAALPPATPEAWVARTGGAFLAEAARTLGRMPTEAIETYLAARRACEDVAAAGGHEAAFAAVRAVAALVRHHVPFDGTGSLDRALLAAHAVELHYDLFERHRAPTAPGPAVPDEAALAALAPG